MTAALWLLHQKPGVTRGSSQLPAFWLGIEHTTTVDQDTTKIMRELTRFFSG